MSRTFAIAIILSASLLAACGAGDDTAAGGAGIESGGIVGSSGSQVSAGESDSPASIQAVPVDIAYEVLGNPVVGQPVAVALRIQASDTRAPLMLSYRVSEPGSLVFPESQASEVELAPGKDEAGHAVQVTVVPQREGRVYLNVSAKMQVAHGSTFKSMAIPILVEGAPTPTRGAPGEADTEQPDADPTPDAAR